MIEQISQNVVWVIFHLLWFGTAVWVVISAVDRFFFTQPVWKYNLNLSAYSLIVVAVPIISFYCLSRNRLIESRVTETTVESQENGRRHGKSTTRSIPKDDSSVEEGLAEDCKTTGRSGSLSHHSVIRNANWQSTFPVSEFQLNQKRVNGNKQVLDNQELENETTGFEGTLKQDLSWFHRVKLFLQKEAYLTVASLYLLGFLIMNFRLLRILIGLWRISSGNRAGSESLATRLQIVSKSFGVRVVPAIRIIDQLSGPAVYGIFRPVLLFPSSMLSGLTVQELDAILLHELAHIKRMDSFVVWFQRLTETVLFFHPVVWLIGNRMDQLREQCCDDYVLDSGFSAVNYARCLCKMAESGKQSARVELVSAAQGKGPSELLVRVRRILKEPSQPKFQFSPSSFGWSILILALSVGSYQSVDAHSAYEIRQKSILKQDKNTEVGFEITVVNDDGGPVSNFEMRFRDSKGRVLSRRSSQPGKFVCDFDTWNLETGIVQLTVVTLNRKEIGTVSLGYNSKLKEIVSSPNGFNQRVNGVSIQLKKAVQRRVVVLKDGRGIKDAEVVLANHSPDFWAESRTAEDGTALMTVSESGKDESLWALHPEKGLGYSKRGEATITLLETAPIEVSAKDEEDQLVPGLELRFFIGFGNIPNINSSKFSRLNQLKTDETGRAVLSCIPKKFQNIVQIQPSFNTGYQQEWKDFRQEQFHEKLGAHRILRVNSRARFPLVGQLIHKGKKVRGKNQVRIYQNEGTDPEIVETDSKGIFQVNLVANQRYNVSVFGDDWDGGFSVFDTGNNKSDKPIAIHLEKTIPVEFRLFDKQTKKSLNGGNVFFHAYYPGATRSDAVVERLLGKKNSDRNKIVLGDFSIRADYRGLATARIPIGSGQVSFTNPSPIGPTASRQNEKIQLTESSKKQFDFYLNAKKEMDLTGRVKVPSGFRNKKITVSLSNRWRSFSAGKYVVQSDGTWNGGGLGWHTIVVECFSSDRQIGGVSFNTIDNGKVPTLHLSQTATISGRLVDGDGQALPYFRLYQLLEAKSLFGRTLWTHQYSDVVTDKDGKFVIKVVPGITQKLAMLFPSGRSHFLGYQRRYKPGETVDAGDIVFEYLKR